MLMHDAVAMQYPGRQAWHHVVRMHYVAAQTQRISAILWALQESHPVASSCALCSAGCHDANQVCLINGQPAHLDRLVL